MIKNYLKQLGCVLLILVGLVFFEMAIREPGGIGARLGMIFCGLIFVLAGFLLLQVLRSEAKQYKKGDAREELKQMFLPGFHEKEDRTELEQRLSAFRKHYSDFYQSERKRENDPIQADVTQIYRNMLEFRRNRLDRLGIRSAMEARRMQYTDAKESVTADTFTDGKYDFSEVREEIAAKTTYYKGEKPIFHKYDRDIANYTLIHAKSAGGNEIICPNCGTPSTRENLLDGCDYCKTKFTVEDLGTRISEFALRTDYEIEYAKFKSYRKKSLYWIAAIVAGVLLVASLLMTLSVAGEVQAEENAGFFMMLVSCIGTVLIASAFFVPIVYGAAVTLLSPVLLAVSGYAYASNKVLKRLKNAKQLDHRIAEQIRSSADPQFSLANFYSGVQNKLASVIYAENEKQIAAFAACELAKYLPRYRNVIGIDVEYIGMTRYQNNCGMQLASVRADLKLTEYRNGKCRLRAEAVTLMLRKNADCKTQAVCAPSVMTCAGCGRSLSLLEGKRCSYCGRELRMEQYDWVIEDYSVK